MTAPPAAADTTPKVARRPVGVVVDWTGRVVLLLLVVWGTWQTIGGLRNLVPSDVNPSPAADAALPADDPSEAILTAMDSWTAPGKWIYGEPANGPSAGSDRLVPMPSGSARVAARVSPARLTLVDLLSTTSTVPALEAHWRAAGWDVVPLTAPENGKTGAYRLARGDDTILIWSVSENPEAGTRTVACARALPAAPADAPAPRPPLQTQKRP